METSKVDLFYGEAGPTPKQQEFSNAAETYKLYGGAIGGGKSYAICAEGLRLSLMFPGNRGFMCRDEAKAFKNTTLVTLLSVIGRIENCIGTKLVLSHNKADERITLRNKSVILYGGLSGRENHDRVKSMELGWYAVDEASECNEKDIDMLETRLRWRLPNSLYPKFFGLYASNPEPGYLKARFVTPQEQGAKHKERLFVQALPSDNKWLPPEYVERICAGKPDYWVSRYINGSWDAAEGQIWPQFDRDIHVFPNKTSRYKIPVPKKGDFPTIFGSLDHGITNPACFLGYYTDQDGNIFVFNEYYDSGLVSKHCREITGLFKLGDFDYTVADPSIWSVSGERNGNPWSINSEYEDNKVYLQPASNAVEAGINRVGEYLYVDETRRHPITGELGSPKLFISDRCVNLIREIVEYIWKTAINIKEAPKKLNDHAVDSLRYGIASRPSAAIEQETGPKPETFDWYMNRSTEEFMRQGVWI